MRKFCLRLVWALAIFGLAILGSYFSAGFGLPWVQDGNRRVGFPMSLCLQETPNLQCPNVADDFGSITIEPLALPVNFAVALLAAALVSVLVRRQEDRGRRFRSVLLLAFAIFGFVTMASYFLRSDGFGLPGVADGDRFVGFPAPLCREGGQANVICKEGGRAIYTRVEPLALLVNFGASLLVAVLAPVLISRLRR